MPTHCHHAVAPPRRLPTCACRFLPLLRPHLVPYQLHLFAEKVDTDERRVAEILLE